MSGFLPKTHLLRRVVALAALPTVFAATSLCAWQMNEAVQSDLISEAFTRTDTLNVLVQRDGQEGRRSLEGMTARVSLTCIKTKEGAQIDGRPVIAGIGFGLFVEEGSAPDGLEVLGAIGAPGTAQISEFKVFSDGTRSDVQFATDSVTRRDVFAPVRIGSEMLFLYGDTRAGAGFEILDIIKSANRTITAQFMIDQADSPERIGVEFVIPARASTKTARELEKRCAG